MKRTIFAATLMAGGLAAATAGALDNVSVKGSDRMESLMRDVLSACPAAAANGISFGGGGAASGANAMISGTQTVAPMVRTPSDAEICSLNGGATAEGLMMALAADAVVSGASEAGACGAALAYSPARSFPVVDGGGNPVIDCPGCQPGTNQYAIADWRDVLALVYAGIHHGAPRVTDCNSPVRRSLVAGWGNLFEHPCQGGPCPQGLRRAFRMGDLSQATDSFNSLVGLPSLPPAQNVPGAVAAPIPFCNAHGQGPVFGGDADFEDRDPIRIPCADGDEVCGPTVPGRVGTLGLVIPIVVPSNLTAEQNYPTRLCDLGVFRFQTGAIFGRPGLCANGLPTMFGKCFFPVATNPDGTATANCIARRFPVQGFGGNGMDGRTYNLFPRRTDWFFPRDNLNRYILGAFYRLHMTRTRTSTLPCRSPGPSSQIACLVAAHGCSLGQAELEPPATTPGAVALAINGVPADRPHIQAIVSTPALDDDYPLTHPLYLNTLLGFENPSLQTGEYELARCLGSSSLIAPIVEARGFVPVPGGVRCRDFASEACPASASDACANNPAGLITP